MNKPSSMIPPTKFLNVATLIKKQRNRIVFFNLNKISSRVFEFNKFENVFEYIYIYIYRERERERES